MALPIRDLNAQVYNLKHFNNSSSWGIPVAVNGTRLRLYDHSTLDFNCSQRLARVACLFSSLENNMLCIRERKGNDI